MNYKHAFHAGNAADVLKHAILVLVLRYLSQKDAPFRLIDTHAGAGLYDLAGDDASRTGEWHDGIGRLLDGMQQKLSGLPPEAAALLAPYLACITACRAEHGRMAYPGSPVLARMLMRRDDRLVLCETAAGPAKALGKAIGRDKRVSILPLDGWMVLKAQIPPKEKRGLVLIDPAFEDRDEFATLARSLADAWRKWPGGVYLAWYPLKDQTLVARFCRNLAESDLRKVLRLELMLGGTSGLTGTGLIAVASVGSHPGPRPASRLAA
jgi:23S rRNA (adenine2030-N6)-methyltransferase